MPVPDTSLSTLPSSKAEADALLKSSGIPDPALDVMLAGRRTVCGFVVDLGALKTELIRGGWTQLYVFADTVVMPPDFALILNNSGMTICARRIEAGQSAQIIIDRRAGAAGALVVYGSEMIGAVKVGIATDTKSDEVALVVAPGGTGYAPPDMASLTMPLNGLASALFDTAMGMAQVLTAQFQLAAVIFPEQPVVAENILAWVTDAAAGVPDGDPNESFWKELTVRAGSLRSFVASVSGIATYVPPLDPARYKAAASGLVSVASTLETSYNRVLDRGLDLDVRKQEARLMLDRALDQSQYLNVLGEDAKSRFDAAQGAVEAANRDYDAQGLKVRLLQEDFKLAVKIKQIDDTVKLVFDVLTTVVSIVVSIASTALLGFPTPPATDGLKNLAKSGTDLNGLATKLLEEAAKLQADPDRINDLQGEITKLTDAAAKASAAIGPIKELEQTIKKIQDTLEKLGKLAGVMRTLIDQSSQLAGLPAKAAKSLAIKLDVSGISDLSAIAEWDRMQIQVETMMDSAIKAGIGKSVELLAAFKILVVNGKALSANQQASLRVADEVLRLQMQAQLVSSEAGRVSGFIDALESGKAADMALAQTLRTRLDEVKRSILMATLNYCWAHRYYALAESRVRPSLLKDVAGLQADLAAAEDDFNNMLNKYKDSPPQPFLREIMIDDDDLIDDFRKTGIVRLTLFQDEGHFADMSRLRISKLSVFLEGANFLNQTRVRLQISASGMYRDRNEKRDQFIFSGTQWSVAFEYQVSSEGFKVTIPGEVAERWRAFYFEPTPLTTWTIALNSNLRSNSELAHVKALRLVIDGTASMR